MSDRMYLFLAVLAGLITGFFTIHSIFEHSWTSIFLWIAVGLTVVYFSPNRRAAIWAGALFGFFDIATWLMTGFQGESSQLTGIISLSVLFGALGAACGALGAIIFYWLFRRS